MADKPQSLQDIFLNGVRRSKTPVTLFLLKGVKLQGVITWFDAFSLLLRRDGVSQLVYKHAISTIVPQASPTIEPAGGEGGKPRRAVLQDLFLEAAERAAEPMTLFLVNGVMIQGPVAAHDQFVLLLGGSDQVQLVYKHAVATIQPPSPLDLGSGEDSEG